MATYTVKSVDWNRLSETSNEYIVTWKFNHGNVKEYSVVFQYYAMSSDTKKDKKGKTKNEWLWIDGSKTKTTAKKASYTAPEEASYIRVKIKPICKLKSSSSKYWKSEYTKYYKTKTYAYRQPDPPSISTSLNEDGSKLTVTCNNLDELADEVKFKFVANNTSVSTKTVKVQNRSASYIKSLSVDTKYRVQAICSNLDTDNKKKPKKYWSEWSEYTSEFTSRPSAPTNFVAKAKSENSVYLTWDGCSTATNYEIWYADNADDMKTQSGDSFRTTQTSSNDPQIIIGGLEAGKKWFFRVRAVNSGGYSDWWKNPSDPDDLTQTVVLGTKPEAPTTWSSETIAKINDTDKVNLYWVHNSEDGSSERYAQVKLVKNGGNPETIELENTNKDEYGEYTDETRVYSISTKNYSDGDELKWSVCTKGIANEYGDWSIERSIKFYEEPSLVIDVLDSEGNPVDTITRFPFTIKCATFPSTATPIGFSLSVEAMESYETDDDVGSSIHVSAGDSIYQKYIDGSSGDTELSVSDIDLQNGSTYKIVGVANFSSGLTATNQDDNKTFEVSFDTSLDIYSLEETNIIPNMNDLTASIIPQCHILANEIESNVSPSDGSEEVATEILYQLSSGYETPPTGTWETVSPEDDNGQYIWIRTTTSYSDGTIEVSYRVLKEATGVSMSVYRREVNGKFTEIGTDATNNYTSFSDPHPSLDIARYRVAVKDVATGAMTYDDFDYEIGETSIIVNWNEEWMTLDANDDDDFTPAWSGSMIKLPYNIDVSESNSLDVSLVEYIGRDRPVSYYGTQLGENPKWTCEIPKSDTETIYQLRRLAVYKGDVYVREPSGTGFWANISVSFNLKHTDLTVPVTLNIKPVEGGM